MTSPSTVKAVLDAYLAKCAKWRGHRPPPAAPRELFEVPAAIKIELCVDLFARHRAGAFKAGAYFAAESAWTVLLESAGELTEGQLCRLLRAIGDTGDHLCGYPWRDAWLRAQRRMDRAGISVELHDALRAMQASMKVHTSDKNAALQIDRALLFEMFSDLDPAEDAVDIVRRDLRSMADDERTTWEKLLLLGMNNPGKHAPRASFGKGAVPLLDGLGDGASSRPPSWLTEIAALEEIRLSRAGAEAIRAVLWVCGELDCWPGPAIVRLCQRPWRRGKLWSTRHERTIGALAWALAECRPARAGTALDALRARFGTSSAAPSIDEAATRLRAR